MQLRVHDLAQRLAKSPLAPIYVVYGEETLLALEAAQTIREAARNAGFSEREVLTVEPGFKWNALTAAGQSVSLFGDRKLIELRISNGKPGVEGGDALQAYAANISATNAPVDNLLLVQLPALEKTQLSSKWFTALDQAGGVVACPLINRNTLPQWISERLARQQQTLTADAMDWLVSRVEGNLLAAKQEIDKLGLLHEAGELNLEQLQTEVANVARYDVWSLGDALVAGDAKRLVRMLDGLHGEGEAPTLVLWVMTDEIRALLRVGLGWRQGQGRPLPELYRENRVWGDKQKHYPVALERLKASVLRAALSNAAEIDRMIKGVAQGSQGDDVWEALITLGLKLM